MRIGILALQGGVEEHAAIVAGLGHEPIRVRLPRQLDGLDAIIIPGGESSVLDKLARSFGLADGLRNRIQEGLPTFATCAGLIYLAKQLTNPAPGQQTLGVLDMQVTRNAFGSQVCSFETELDVVGLKIPATFIRAPRVDDPGAAEVIATLPDGGIVGVRSAAIWAFAFHPEENEDARLHAAWLRSI